MFDLTLRIVYSMVSVLQPRCIQPAPLMVFVRFPVVVGGTDYLHGDVLSYACCLTSCSILTITLGVIMTIRFQAR